MQFSLKKNLNQCSVPSMESIQVLCGHFSSLNLSFPPPPPYVACLAWKVYKFFVDISLLSIFHSHPPPTPPPPPPPPLCSVPSMESIQVLCGHFSSLNLSSFCMRSQKASHPSLTRVKGDI